MIPHRMGFTRLAILVVIRLASAHPWVEQLSTVAMNRSFAGYGYPRGFVDKDVANFDQSANI